MSSGLLALLDDVAAIAKMAAASLDDAAGQAAAASGKAAGIVIDDTAVTPRYVIGFGSERELPIIARIARGSLRNKLLYLLPGALLLSAVAPWAIVPLLIVGGVYLCLEGYEKVHEWLVPPHALAHPIPDPTPAPIPAHQADAGGPAVDARALEDARVAGAIRTDLILSAEIMAIALASVAGAPFLTKAIALVGVAILVTVLVYGLVAVIVKADDVGVVMARQSNAVVRSLGRGLVAGMPHVLSALSVVGTVAMLWVGGGIVVHGLHELGLSLPEYAVKAVASGVAAVVPDLAAVLSWLVTAALSAAIGLVIGAIAAKSWHALSTATRQLRATSFAEL